MERIKNLISPRTRRKKLELAAGDTGINIIPTASPKTFGVALENLMVRAPSNATVPSVVSRICQYIYKYGLDSVGLFRVSGSVRVVERMRMQIELTGDVNLEEENDVAATAGLLRVFLRDLPDTLVPARLTHHFFTAVQDSQRTKEETVADIKKALNLLPDENLCVLKYITSLLVVVAENEADNKMSAFSLAILFGPNVFRYELTSGMEGLRDMDSSKDVMHLFISEFDTLFAGEGEPSPKEFWAKCTKRRSPPPRPPPPKVQSLPSFSSPSAESITATLTSSASSSSLDYRPIPSPRKIKNLHDSNSSSETEGRQTPTRSLSSTIPLFSPRDDVDHSRAHSPFALESETHSIIESPMVTARTHECVEKAIVETISEHIFGGMDFNQNSGPQSPQSPQKTGFDDVDTVDGSPVDLPTPKPRTASPLKPGPSQIAGTSHSSSPDFDDVERSEILTGHKKPVGPPRRTPSRKHRRSWEVGKSEMNPLPVKTPFVVASSANETCTLNRSLNHMQEDRDKENEGSYSDEQREDGNGSPTLKAKSSRRMEKEALSLQSSSMQNSQESTHQDAPAANGSSLIDRSPSNGIKLFIPPLDLSILHEHVDGVEAIPVSIEQSDNQMWIRTNQLSGPEETDVAIISPRSHKLRKRNEFSSCAELETPVSVVIEAPMSPSAYCSGGLFRASLNTDIPPSPPIQQDLYKKHSDDEGSHRLRQLTKKIQGLKKKIKNFEESFEKEHGYKPSQGEKAAQPDVKKYINELTKARKDLKRLKEDTERVNRSRHNSGASSSGVEQSPPVTPSVVTTLEFILKCLKEKRQESGRPEEVMLMSRDQVQEEKLAVQRALLHFEGLHGRPTTREEKDLMRPLYDRYRSVKRMLAKPMSPRNSLELQTVPEDQMIEIPQSFSRNPIRVPTADLEEDRTSTPDVGTIEFGLVTQDLTVLQEIDLPFSHDKGTDKGLQQAGGGGDEVGDDGSARSEDSGGDAHLHEMSLSELHVEIETSRSRKKRLRRVLREFEEDFLQQNGRKVQKEDRHPLQTEYSDYKKVKARLRLMEALVLKHHE